MAGWRQVTYMITVPVHDGVDPLEHMHTLLEPLFGDDWELALVSFEEPVAGV